MRCPNCQSEYEDAANYCPGCGCPNPTLQQQPPIQQQPQIPQQPGAQPIYAPYVQPAPYVGFFIASMVLGIISIWIWPIGLITGALAIIFYFQGRNKWEVNPVLRGKAMGTAGLITGIVGASLCAVYWFVLLAIALSH